MYSPNTETHSFVIKVWLEECGGGKENRVLRGHITHVVTGERRYLNNLDSIRDFISPYLGEKSGFYIKIKHLAKRLSPDKYRARSI